MRTYKPLIGKLLLSIFDIFFWVGLLFFYVTILNIQTSIYRLLLQIGLLAIGIFLLVKSCYLNFNTYVLKDNKLIIRRYNQIRYEFDMAEVPVSSKVTKHYTNGIPTGVQLELIVKLPAQELRFACANLGKKQFNQLMSDIDLQYDLLSKNDEQQPVVEPQIFTLTKREAKGGISALEIILFMTSIFMLITINLFYTYEKLSLGFWIMIGVYCLIILSLIILISSAHKKRLLQLEVTKQSIKANQTIIPVKTIHFIHVTPPSYTNGDSQRIIEFVTDETVYKSSYGKNNDKKTAPQYEAVLDSLQAVMGNKPGVLVYRRV